MANTGNPLSGFGLEIVYSMYSQMGVNSRVSGQQSIQESCIKLDTVTQEDVEQLEYLALEVPGTVLGIGRK